MRIIPIYLFFPILCFTQDWGLNFKPLKEKDLTFRIGTRLQGIAEYNSYSKNDSLDFYARRMRLQVLSTIYKDWKIYFDIRNDNSNKEFDGEGKFKLGDGYLQIPLSSQSNLKLFRSKVDLSYSQTVSSSNLIHLTRSQISGTASNFVSQSRRATNIQYNLKNKNINFQAVLGDGISDKNLKDSKGNSSSDIMSQGPMIGSKVRYFFLGDARKKIKETNHSKEKSISLGAGYFSLLNLKFKNSSNQIIKSDRGLFNLELVFHLNNLTFINEFFLFNGLFKDFTIDKSHRAHGFYSIVNYQIGNFSIFSRYERTESKINHKHDGYLLGFNYYIKKNKIRIGLAGSLDERTLFNQEVKEKNLSSNIMIHY